MITKYYLLNRILLILSFGIIQSCGESKLDGRCFEYRKNGIKESLCFFNADSALYEVFIDDRLIYKSISSYYFDERLNVVNVDREELNESVKILLKENDYLCVGRLLGNVENLNNIFLKTYIYRHNKIEINCSLIEVDN